MSGDGSEEVGLIDVIERAEELVKARMKDNDPSHDWHHVHRVRLMALSLSRCPSLAHVGTIDPIVLELGALFHDLCDAKYLPQNSATGPTTAKTVLSDFFEPFLAGGLVNAEQVQCIYHIVDSTSWSKEEKRRAAKVGEDEETKWQKQCGEFQCVSDADRLDAIGSIGILRVAAFSGAKDRPLHIPPANPAQDSVPPAEQGEGYNGSAVAHFHSKLLKIKDDRLWTDMARSEASRRQSMMQSFLTELDLEWLVADQGAQLSLLQE